MDATIDGHYYSSVASLTVAYGEGEDEDEFSLQCLRAPSGTTVYLQQKDEEFSHDCWLYWQSDLRWTAELGSTRESLEIEVIEEFEPCQLEWSRLEWVTLHQPLETPPEPFKGGRRALVIHRETGEPLLCAAVRLYRNSLGTLTSERCPASRLPKVGVPEAPPSSPSMVMGMAGLLATVLLFGAFQDSDLALQFFWWGAPVALFLVFSGGRVALFREPLRFYSGAFFLHFATHALDSLMPGLLLESVRAVAGLALLLVLRQKWRTLYHVALDAGNAGGGLAWLLTIFAFGMIEEKPILGPDFPAYSGALGWSILSLAFLLIAIVKIGAQYQRVPLSAEGFRDGLEQTRKRLKEGVDSVLCEAEELTGLALPMVKALELSADPKVVALNNFATDLSLWAECTQTLQHLKADKLPAADRELLAADLDILASDLGSLLDNYEKLGEGTANLTNLRISPYLRWS